jgi:hypothetical protein
MARSGRRKEEREHPKMNTLIVKSATDTSGNSFERDGETVGRIVAAQGEQVPIVVVSLDMHASLDLNYPRIILHMPGYDFSGNEEIPDAEQEV